MYFDFEDGHPDLERVPSALTAREGVLLTIIVHLLVIILISSCCRSSRISSG